MKAIFLKALRKNNPEIEKTSVPFDILLLQDLIGYPKDRQIMTSEIKGKPFIKLALLMQLNGKTVEDFTNALQERRKSKKNKD